MNEAQKIIIDGLATLPWLTPDEAHRIVEIARRDREEQIKRATLKELGAWLYRPIPVLEFRASYPPGEVCPPVAMHYSARAQWVLETGHAPVTVLIPQGEEKRRVIAILKRHTKLIETLSDEKWAEHNQAIPSWPPVEMPRCDDDIPF